MSRTCQAKSNTTCAIDQHGRHSSKPMHQIDNKRMTMQRGMKEHRLPCKTRLATKPCNGVNTGSKLRCKTATTNNMESKKVKLISHAKRDVQVPPTDEGQRTNIMHMQSSSRRATKKRDEIGRLAGFQRERPQARSIQLQCGPPTEKGGRLSRCA